MKTEILRAKDAHEVIALLRNTLDAGDVVLVKGLWQQRLGRVGLALSGRKVMCRADPCPFQRQMCAECPFLELPFEGAPPKALAGATQPFGSTAIVTSGVMPGKTFTATLYVPSILSGSSRSILWRSMLMPRRSSASAMSLAVMEP